jgi:apolipoprotein N-acyltransferase
MEAVVSLPASHGLPATGTDMATGHKLPPPARANPFAMQYSDATFGKAPGVPSGPIPARWRLPLAALAGLLQALSIADPWSGSPHDWLQILSLSALCALVARAPTVRSGIATGWVFSTVWLASTFWWLFISLHTYGGLSAPLTITAVVGLAAFLGSYYAGAAGIFHAFAPASPMKRAPFFAALWLLAELMRNSFFTGFPWGAGGYAHVDGMAQWLARWIGVYGIGAVASLIAAWLAAALPLGRWRRALAVVAACWIIGTVATLWVDHTSDDASRNVGERMPVELLQGNIPQDEKFQPGSGVPLALRWYADQLLAARGSLVVTPETAVPLLPSELPAGYEAVLRSRFSAGEQAALIGIPLGSAQGGYTNSMIGLRPGAADTGYRYDKHHLVPFGEFVPPMFRWFTDLLQIPLADFQRGPVGQASFDWQGQRLAPNICYEDLFGDELARRFRNPATAPTIMVNASNIGWFGDSVAIDQHLAISRMRALELERPILRATNTGATAVIDHHGNVTASLEPYTRGVLRADVQGRSGITPFAWWASRWGLAPLWLLGLAVTALGVLTGRRRLREERRLRESRERLRERAAS